MDYGLKSKTQITKISRKKSRRKYSEPRQRMMRFDIKMTVS